jgi:hypothetical protein
MTTMTGALMPDQPKTAEGPRMRTIEVSEEIYVALDDILDPDIPTHDAAIGAMLSFTEALVEQNAKLIAERDRIAVALTYAVDRRRGYQAKCWLALNDLRKVQTL